MGTGVIKRSSDANKYFHGPILNGLKSAFAKKVGIDFDLNIIKFQFKKMFEVESTSKLSESDFYWFCEKCRQWCLDNLGHYIETPDEYRQNNSNSN